MELSTTEGISIKIRTVSVIMVKQKYGKIIEYEHEIRRVGSVFFW
jgi:hypothetical protein